MAGHQPPAPPTLLALAFGALDADADGLVGIEDLYRVTRWCPDLQAIAPCASLKIAFDAATASSRSGMLAEPDFTGAFMSHLGQLHPNRRLGTGPGSEGYARAVISASFSMLFAALLGGGGPLSSSHPDVRSSSAAGGAAGGDALQRADMAPLLDAITAAAQGTGELRSAQPLRGLDIFGPPAQTVASDAFVAAMFRVVVRGVTPATLMRASLAHRRQQQADAAAASAASSAPPTSPHDHKGMAAAFGRVNSKSPGRLRSQSFAAPSSDSASAGAGGGGSNASMPLERSASMSNAGALVRAEERCRQLQAQVADLQKEIERLRKSGGGDGGGNRNSTNSGVNNEARALQRELTDMKDAQAAAKGATERALAERDDRIAALERAVAERDDALMAAKGRAVVLERYAASHESWISLMDGFKSSLTDIVEASFDAAKRLRADEADNRAAVAATLLAEARRKTQTYRDVRAEAEELMATVKSREEELSMREAMLVVRESKFATMQRRAEEVALPERERRLEMLKSIERDAGAQLASIRTAQQALLEREHRTVAETEQLREQVAFLNRALLDAERRASTASPSPASASGAAAARAPSSSAPSPHAKEGYPPRRLGTSADYDDAYHRQRSMSFTRGDDAGGTGSPSPQRHLHHHAHHTATDSGSPPRAFYW